MKATINVESAKTKNYQKYTAGISIEVEVIDNKELEGKIAYYQAMCRKKVVEQLEID